MKIATIARAAEHSPNMSSNDAAILACVTRELIRRGAEVVHVDEEGNIPHDTDIVCHMSRSCKTLSMLEQAQEKGMTVLNAPEAVKNCSRCSVMRILESKGIPQPTFRILNSSVELEGVEFPAWIKRADGWSCHKDDICHVRNMDEAKDAIARMKGRGIAQYVYTAHCEGDIIKFYGVGERYFTYGYPSCEKTKFGLEKINGAPRHFHFDAEMMRRIATEAAKSVGLEIYGGDCIIGADGSIAVIDLNDFPSFSSVREEAAAEIAECIIESRKEKI